MSSSICLAMLEYVTSFLLIVISLSNRTILTKHLVEFQIQDLRDRPEREQISLPLFLIHDKYKQVYVCLVCMKYDYINVCVS